MSIKNKRKLNYELLRIIAMLMIVCLHYLSKGSFLDNPERSDMTMTGYAVWFVEALCLVVVNVYVLISGYFGIDASIKGSFIFQKVLKRPLKILRQVFLFCCYWF